MSVLRNLKRLNGYLESFSIPDVDAGFHFVTAAGDATTLLDKLTGDRVLLARPEQNRSAMENDRWEDTIDTAVFVLARHLDQGRTQKKENAQFDRLLAIADVVLAKIENDAACSCGCADLSGFVLTNVVITPEPMLFGSWQGWSIDLSFRI